MKPHTLALIAVLSCVTALAQNPSGTDAPPSPYYHGLRRSPAIQETMSGEASTGFSGTGSNYDVKYHKVFWRINPDSTVKYIKGFVQTNFETNQSGVSTISFDLNSVLTIDSVRFRNARLATGNINRTGNVVTVTLGVTLGNKVMDSIWVYYRGTPPAVSGAAEGYQLRTDPTTSQKYIYSLSESYEDRDWWPCKADMQDKIDSMDIIVSVPWTGADTFWVASNGRLVDSTISGSNRFFTYKNRYPMASYLVSVAVARFNRYYYPRVNVSGTMVPVVFYLHRGKSAANYNTILTAMSRQSQVLTEFSNKFGDYPYKAEKHGFYEGLGGAGGMEHQTFSAISGGSTSGSTGSLASATTLAHELMHQWFGDKATFATWADLWLAEGFARYGEALAGELVPATGISPNTEMSAAKTAARGIATTPTRLTSFGTSNTIWSNNNISAVYDRGCMVVSMLRALSGDTRFFQACTNYLDSTIGSGYKSANTDSLKNNFNRVLNYDLTPFFNDFVTGVGHPNTVINWNSYAPNKLAVSVASQTRSASSTVSYFHNVIILRVQGASAGQDTTIVIYDIDGNNLAYAGNGISASVPGNQLIYHLSFTPTTVTFDPFSRTMSAGSTVQISTLDLRIVDFYARSRGSYNEATLVLDDNSTNSPITLERSADGVTFYEIGTMDLQPATGAFGKTYQLDDIAPLNGNNYYRAWFIGASGQRVYSKVVNISNKTKKQFTVINNPVTNGRLQIKAANNASVDNKNYQLSVYDVAGKLLLGESRTINGNITTMNTGQLPAGTYVLKITDTDGLAELLRFVVK